MKEQLRCFQTLSNRAYEHNTYTTYASIMRTHNAVNALRTTVPQLPPEIVKLAVGYLEGETNVAVVSKQTAFFAAHSYQELAAWMAEGYHAFKNKQQKWEDEKSKMGFSATYPTPIADPAQNAPLPGDPVRTSLGWEV